MGLEVILLKVKREPISWDELKEEDLVSFKRKEFEKKLIEYYPCLQKNGDKEYTINTQSTEIYFGNEEETFSILLNIHKHSGQLSLVSDISECLGCTAYTFEGDVVDKGYIEAYSNWTNQSLKKD